jgi:hypothetical protein
MHCLHLHLHLHLHPHPHPHLRHEQFLQQLGSQSSDQQDQQESTSDDDNGGLLYFAFMANEYLLDSKGSGDGPPSTESSSSQEGLKHAKSRLLEDTSSSDYCNTMTMQDVSLFFDEIEGEEAAILNDIGHLQPAPISATVALNRYFF